MGGNNQPDARCLPSSASARPTDPNAAPPISIPPPTRLALPLVIFPAVTIPGSLGIDAREHERASREIQGARAADEPARRRAHPRCFRERQSRRPRFSGHGPSCLSTRRLRHLRGGGVRVRGAYLVFDLRNEGIDRRTCVRCRKHSHPGQSTSFLPRRDQPAAWSQAMRCGTATVTGSGSSRPGPCSRPSALSSFVQCCTCVPGGITLASR